VEKLRGTVRAGSAAAEDDRAQRNRVTIYVSRRRWPPATAVVETTPRRRTSDVSPGTV